MYATSEILRHKQLSCNVSSAPGSSGDGPAEGVGQGRKDRGGGRIFAACVTLTRSTPLL